MNQHFKRWQWAGLLGAALGTSAVVNADSVQAFFKRKEFREAFDNWFEQTLQEPPAGVRRSLRRSSRPGAGEDADVDGDIFRRSHPPHPPGFDDGEQLGLKRQAQGR